MKNNHYFLYSVVPVPKNGSKTTKSGFHYTAAHVKKYSNNIKELTRMQWGGDIIKNEPLKAVVVFHIPRPKTITQDKRKYPHVKPDLDNLEKALWDSMEGIVFDNDSRIVSKVISKRYSNEGMIEVKLRILK